MDKNQIDTIKQAFFILIFFIWSRHVADKIEKEKIAKINIFVEIPPEVKNKPKLFFRNKDSGLLKIFKKQKIIIMKEKTTNFL